MRPAAKPSPVPARPGYLEFFAGSGLVSQALAPSFTLLWANDICPKKAAVFTANHPDAPFAGGSIAEVNGQDLPAATLSWASFPCQDLSLAGATKGIRGARSGLVWEWLRVMDEMPARPPLVVAENVVGLVSAKQGAHYRELHAELARRGYRVGALVLDALRFVPQSRPRVFVVAASKARAVPPRLCAPGPTWPHPAHIARLGRDLPDFVWWRLPEPEPRSSTLQDLLEYDAPCQDEATSQKNIALIPEGHLRRLEQSGLNAAPGYKRMRGARQVLELRFDDVAGCLRTPSGGSSRQYVVIRQSGAWRTRLLTPREAARLMGAAEGFKLPGSFNDGLRAMGDAVAAPVAGYLAEQLLLPLVLAWA